MCVCVHFRRRLGIGQHTWGYVQSTSSFWYFPSYPYPSIHLPAGPGVTKASGGARLGGGNDTYALRLHEHCPRHEAPLHTCQGAGEAKGSAGTAWSRFPRPSRACDTARISCSSPARLGRLAGASSRCASHPAPLQLPLTQPPGPPLRQRRGTSRAGFCAGGALPASRCPRRFHRRASPPAAPWRRARRVAALRAPASFWLFAPVVRILATVCCVTTQG